MSRPFSQRDYLSGRTNTDTHLVPRERPFPEDASEMPGASSLDDQGQRYFADGEDWLADLPGGSEVMIPTWESVPEGWFEIGGVSGLPAGRRLIGNRFSINYTLTDTLSWAIITPSNLYTDATRSTPVTTPPSPVGGVDDASSNENHWAQDVSADRMIWDTYTRDGETISGLRSDAGNQEIDVPLGGAGAGSVLVFFRDSAFYAPADFGGEDVVLRSYGLPIEEMLFLNRALTSTELAELIAAVRKERNRQPLDNWATYGTASLDQAWDGWYWLTDFPIIDTSTVTSLQGAWRGCSGLNGFPALDTSAVTDFGGRFSNPSKGGAWQDCSGLTSFPQIDTSSGQDFESAWRGCSSLTSFPQIDTSSGQNFTSAWGGCSSLTSFPQIDTSSGQNFTSAWGGCSSLTSFPQIDTSSGQEFKSAWKDCSSLTSFPQIDTSNGTSFFGAWKDCSSLTSFPQIDTSSGQEFRAAWEGCSSLTSFPLLDFSGAQPSDAGTFNVAWKDCSSLSDFPAGAFDDAQTPQFGGAFNNCALTQQSVDNILVSVASMLATHNTDGSLDGGSLSIDGGTSAAPSATGEAAIDDLRAAGWTVNVNGGY